MEINISPAESFDDFVAKSLKQWKANITMAQTIGKTLGDRYCEVRYEDLLIQPGHELSSMVRFLGVNEDQKILEQCVKNASFEKMGDGHPQSNDINTAFVRKGIRGDWKNHFSPDLNHRAWSITGDLLESLGYPSL
jgi:hypothetical protein